MPPVWIAPLQAAIGIEGIELVIITSDIDRAICSYGW